VAEPELYWDLIIVPQITGVDPMRFLTEYPPTLKMLMRRMALQHVAAGWGGNLQVIRRG
jgi:hypothetical protein